MDDAILLAAAVGGWLLVLALLGVLADAWDRMDARDEPPRTWTPRGWK